MEANVSPQSNHADLTDSPFISISLNTDSVINLFISYFTHVSGEAVRVSKKLVKMLM